MSCGSAFTFSSTRWMVPHRILRHLLFNHFGIEFQQIHPFKETLALHGGNGQFAPSRLLHWLQPLAQRPVSGRWNPAPPLYDNPDGQPTAQTLHNINDVCPFDMALSSRWFSASPSCSILRVRYFCRAGRFSDFLTVHPLAAQRLLPPLPAAVLAKASRSRSGLPSCRQGFATFMRAPPSTSAAKSTAPFSIGNCSLWRP